MKNHRFPWLRNRTTDNRKCEKARNIKEKRTIEMFNTVLKQLVVLHNSLNVSQNILLTTLQRDSKPLKPFIYGLWVVFYISVNCCE